MQEKIFVVTGANSGVGFEATRTLARAGASVVLACRNLERGQAALARIRGKTGNPKLTLMALDLARLDDVRAFASRVRERFGRLDGLVNNAGIYSSRLGRTVDGFESTMATNHLGPYLLTRLLEETLAGSSVGVVNVSSEAHRRGDLRRRPLPEIFRGDGKYGAIQAYSDSKLANLLLTFELGRRWRPRDIRANALHPGVLATRIWNHNRDPLSLLIRLFKPLMAAPEKGGESVMRVIAAAQEGTNGSYFKGTERVQASKAAYDEELATCLWEESERATGLRD
ncbi:MAG: SDR family NAD(P)-dependent oxidoreductase [Gemmatimonadota bacterium]